MRSRKPLANIGRLMGGLMGSLKNELTGGLNSRLGAAIACAVLAGAASAEDEFVYRAQRGDTLIGIGRRLLAEPRDWRTVARLNRIADPDLIVPAQAIRIPARLLRGEPTPGRVSAAVGEVQLVPPGGVAVAAEDGAAVTEGTRIVTGDNGYVTIRLADGSTLRVQAGSQTQLAQARALGAAGFRSQLRLLAGRIEAFVSQVRGGAARFDVRTPQAAIAVRGTDFRVAADVARAQTRSEVLSGTIELQAAPRSDKTQRSAAQDPIAVAAGYAAAVDAAARVGAPVGLLPAPDVTALPALQERLLVRFVVPALAGATAYRAQIARDREFDHIAGALASDTPELRFADLADAEYFLRVRAIDAAGFEGRDAVHAFRLKARPEPPTPAGPAPRAKLPAQRVEFAWTSNPQAARYRLEVARDEAFAAIVRREETLTGAEHALDGLAPGTYFWRLASTRPDGDPGPWGDAQQFELRALPSPPAPAAIGESAIRLAWGGSAGQTFEFQLARDAAFRDLALERTLREPTIEFPRPAPGRYFVRYRARDADGYLGPFTSPQSIELPNCVRAASGGCVTSAGGPLLAQ